MMNHLDMVQHARRVAITQEERHWSDLILEGQRATTTPNSNPQKATREEKMLYGFVEACIVVADTVFDNSINPLPDGWAKNER
jgi:hypothetical protein